MTFKTTVAEIASPEARSIAIGPFGSSLKADMYTDHGVPVVRGQNIQDSPNIDRSELVYVSPETASQFPGSLLEAGDLVFPHRGAIGRVGFIDEGPMLLSSSMMKLRCDRTKVAPRFMLYYFRGPGRAEILTRASTVGTPGIGQPLASLRSMTLELPPLDQQQAIAEVLGALDDKIAANLKLARTIEELGAARFRRLGLDSDPIGTAQELSDLLDVNPRRVLASDTATVIDMQALPTSQPLVSSWTEGPKKGGTRFQNGDTLIARITPCLENRKTAFVDFLRQDQVGIGSTEFIVLRSKAGLPLGLSYFMAISHRFREFAIQHMVGTSGRQRVSATDLQRHTLSEIPREELVEFGRWADTHLELLGSQRTESQILTKLRDTLIPHLMSGKLRVKDAEKVVEGAL